MRKQKKLKNVKKKINATSNFRAVFFLRREEYAINCRTTRASIPTHVKFYDSNMRLINTVYI